MAMRRWGNHYVIMDRLVLVDGRRQDRRRDYLRHPTWHVKSPLIDFAERVNVKLQ